MSVKIIFWENPEWYPEKSRRGKFRAQLASKYGIVTSIDNNNVALADIIFIHKTDINLLTKNGVYSDQLLRKIKIIYGGNPTDLKVPDMNNNLVEYVGFIDLAGKFDDFYSSVTGFSLNQVLHYTYDFFSKKSSDSSQI